MKSSYYNILTDLESGEFLLYNTDTEAMVVLSREEKEEYERICSGDLNAGALFDSLLLNRFILEEPEEEAAWLEYEYEKYKFNNRLFELVIAPTIDCNFRCAYCYEHKRPGFMGKEVQDALLRFVDESYAQQPFREFRVTWYGGEPLLGPEIIEYLSRGFLDFCEQHGVAYHAALMTNGSLADKEMMDRMYACGVKSVQVTFGGKGKVHDRERVSVDGSPSFRSIWDNTNRMLDDGTAVHVEYVYDADNLESCVEVAKDLGPHDNIFTHFPYPKMDYNNEFYDDEGNCMFNLQSPYERAMGYKDIILATCPDAVHWHQLLRPLKHYCGVQTERFYVIDEQGRAYKCICDVDKPDTHALFNICESSAKRKVNWEKMVYYMRANPVKNKTCRVCKILPICNGYCYIDRDPDRDWVPVRCHPMKFVIHDWLREYYKAKIEEGA